MCLYFSTTNTFITTTHNHNKHNRANTHTKIHFVFFWIFLCSSFFEKNNINLLRKKWRRAVFDYNSYWNMILQWLIAMPIQYSCWRMYATRSISYFGAIEAGMFCQWHADSVLDGTPRMHPVHIFELYSIPEYSSRQYFPPFQKKSTNSIFGPTLFAKLLRFSIIKF